MPTAHNASANAWVELAGTRSPTPRRIWLYATAICDGSVRRSSDGGSARVRTRRRCLQVHPCASPFSNACLTTSAMPCCSTRWPSSRYLTTAPSVLVDHRLVELCRAEPSERHRPVDRLGDARRLVEVEFAERLDRTGHLAGQQVVDVGHAQLDDRDLAFEVGVLDPVVEAPALQRVVDVAGAVRREHHQRRAARSVHADLRHGDLVVGQHLEQVRLELVVGPIDLVDQQHRWRPLDRLDRPQQGALDQESFAVQLGLEIVGGRESRFRPWLRPHAGGAADGRSPSRRRPARRRCPRSTGGGSVRRRSSPRAPWRARSCRLRPHPRGAAVAAARSTGTRRWRSPRRGDIPGRERCRNVGWRRDGGSGHDGDDIQGAAHQVDEVVVVEGVASGHVGVGERRLESLDRAAAAFDVRVVRGEQAHLGAGLLDDPPDVLGRVRRGPDLPAHVLARAHRELLQALLVAGERVERRLHLAHPRRHPDRALLDHADLEASGSARTRRRRSSWPASARAGRGCPCSRRSGSSPRRRGSRAGPAGRCRSSAGR